MRSKFGQWDYLIVTASNEAQAQAYESQLRIRRKLGFLSEVREVMVVADPGGRRVGSGGSTLYCLLEVLNRQSGQGGLQSSNRDMWEQVLKKLRILVIHAGGDSRRLVAYGPCGKIFIPVPGESDSVVPLSLFDLQLPIYLALPGPAEGSGQVVITSGDVLLRFEASEVNFAAEGVTGLACYAEPEQASRHGVFCRGQADVVRLYLQKPSVAEQKEKGAVDPYGQVCLDIGVMNFDAATVVRMLEAFGACAGREGKIGLSDEMDEAIRHWGLDFYREICCAMGSEASEAHHVRSARSSGSKWDDAELSGLFKALSGVPFSMRLLKRCDFLDFGTSRAIISSGTRLMQEDDGTSDLRCVLDINNEIIDGGEMKGSACWVEGCRISSSLALSGENVVVGVDIDEPVCLPPKACLDVIGGRDKHDGAVWFVRCYGVDDNFKATIEEGGSFCGVGILEWLEAVGAECEDVWGADLDASERSVWNARLFPAARSYDDYRRWLWMLDLGSACQADFDAWKAADRYSPEQILALAGHSDFYNRRRRIRAKVIQRSLHRMFRPGSEFSASELAYLLKDADDLSVWICDILMEAYRHFVNDEGRGIESLVFPRIIHTLGSALIELGADKDGLLRKALGGLKKIFGAAELKWLKSLGLELDSKVSLSQWSLRAQEVGFEYLGDAIVSSGIEGSDKPRSVLRGDEIVWARAPARLDVGGGWTDTPPYCLEYGGCVVNAAVNLNGQPPIQAYVRVIDQPIIRINSIDLGAGVEITKLDELLDYRKATGSFALAKAALALSGLSTQGGAWPAGISLKEMLTQFGGGIELTALAAIPKGSGLGTSSIMGAVIISAVQRVMGRTLSRRQLFHSVLRLEQALTTGGGWQDQIGGVVDGVKMITTEPGLIADAGIRYLPGDVLEPKVNGGQSLLYYTGITRLAKNILQQVVGRYLNRDRATMAALSKIRLVAGQVAESLVCKDISAFGNLVDAAWQLNKQLDPNSSNDEIELLLERVGPFIYGAKLLGAGGGGFLLMICKSQQDAIGVREILESEPPNELARFFDFDISSEGLTVTVC